VRALDARLAEERVEPVVAAQGDEPLVLDPVPPQQDAGDRGLEVVVADPACRHPTNVREGAHMPLEERLLGLVGERHREAPPRPGQPHDKQPQAHQHLGDVGAELAEVDLGLLTRGVLLGHRHLASVAGQLRPDPRHQRAHGRLGHHRAALVPQPLPHPAGGVALLGRRGEIGDQPLADGGLVRTQRWRLPLGRLARRRDRALQRLPDRAPMDPMPAGQLPDASAFITMLAADHLELLHPRSHPFSLAPLAVVTTERKGERSGWGHLWPSLRPLPGPDQAVIPIASSPRAATPPGGQRPRPAGCRGQPPLA
jgi:hypothetical protein